MITIESGAVKVNRGIEEVPITYWPVGELWDIPNLLDEDQTLLGQVVLPRPTRIPVEERARRVEEEIRLKFRERVAKAQEQWRPIYYQEVAKVQAERSQFERESRAAKVQQEHERKMAEIAAKLQEKEAEAREREALLATQQQLSLFRQAQRTIESEESLIRAQREREQMEAMRQPRPPITPVTPPAFRPETPTTPATPLPETVFRPGTPVAPPARAAVPALMPERAFVTEPARPVAPPVQRITGGGAPVPIRAAAPAQATPRATQEAAYQMQMSRMYPSAGDMQAAREMQIRAAQLSDMGAYPHNRPIRRIVPGSPYQISRQRVAYRQAQTQRAAQARRQAEARYRATAPRQQTSLRARTPVFQPMTRRAATVQRRAARPTTVVGRSIARRSPIPQQTQNIISALRRYR